MYKIEHIIMIMMFKQFFIANLYIFRRCLETFRLIVFISGNLLTLPFITDKPLKLRSSSLVLNNNIPKQIANIFPFLFHLLRNHLICLSSCLLPKLIATPGKIILSDFLISLISLVNILHNLSDLAFLDFVYYQF